jgi:3'-phosphoadenosine 5'-phosphosulfate sulfotransferase
MGGPERTFTLTRKELSEQIEHSYWQGFDFGRERAGDELRDEIRAELEQETFDPSCPMCQLSRELAGVQAELDVVRQRLDDIKADNRSWAIREGRYPYRETR